MQLGRDVLVVDDGVALEIQFKTADIEIRGADRADLVVHGDALAVQKTLVVDIDLDAAFHQGGGVVVRDPVHERMVGLVRDHQAYVDT